MEFKGSLGNYTILRTEDGSLTVHSGVYDENCHSTSGAWQETVHNYVQGCQVLEKLEVKPKVTIFEVGFGVGLGIYACLNQIKAHFDNHEVIFKRLHFISTEIDRDFAIWALTESDFAKEYTLTKSQLVETESKIEVEIDGCLLTILIGDARETITLISDEVLLDCIFQDPFSFRKNPTLWTLEWFRNLRSLSYEETVLSTYSSSARVRKTMLSAGFKIIEREGFGRKRTCTQAVCYTPANNKLNEQLERSKAKIILDEEVLNQHNQA